MKKQIVYMDTSVTVDVKLPAGKIDLEKWLFEMSDADYRSCSPAHLAMGISTLPDGKKVCINVERIGGTTILHHYVPVVSRNNYLNLVSEKTSVISGRPMDVRVTWELSVTPVSSASSKLTCHVTASTDNKIVAWLGKLLGSQASDQHNREESPLFARDMERKFA